MSALSGGREGERGGKKERGMRERGREGKRRDEER